MTRTRAGILLLVVQLALVLSVTGKYVYDRRTRPRVWSRAEVVDPNTPLRGRYLALKLLVNACPLPHDKDHFVQVPVYPGITPAPKSFWRWKIAVGYRDGNVVVNLDEHAQKRHAQDEFTLFEDQPCEKVPLNEMENFFIPDTAKNLIPLKKGQELWVEVTMPKSGPPRPIQLALGHDGTFEPLYFEAEGLPSIRLP